MNIHSYMIDLGKSLSVGLGRQLILKSYSSLEGVTVHGLICKSTKVAFSIQSNCSGSVTPLSVLYIFMICYIKGVLQ